MFDNIISVFKSGGDTTMYAISGMEENELILASVLNGAFDAISDMLKANMDRTVMLENLELVLLTFDEVVDGG